MSLNQKTQHRAEGDRHRDHGVVGLGEDGVIGDGRGEPARARSKRLWRWCGAEQLGYAAAEVLNQITPADISDPLEAVARAATLSAELGTEISPGFEALVFKASRGIEDIYELTYIRKDGSRFPALVSVTALRDEQNVIIGYLLIGTDNTARQQVEAEQRKLDQRLRDQQFYTRSLIESNIDALMTTDPSGIISDVNKQMELLTGCTRDELIGRSMYCRNVVSNFSPPARTRPATRKKRAALPTSDASRKPGTLSAATPAAIVKTLYGMGENPATKTTSTPYSSNQRRLVWKASQ